MTWRSRVADVNPSFHRACCDAIDAGRVSTTDRKASARSSTMRNSCSSWLNKEENQYVGEEAGARHVPRTRPEGHTVFTAACGVKLATRQSGAFDGKTTSTGESGTRKMLRSCCLRVRPGSTSSAHRLLSFLLRRCREPPLSGRLPVSCGSCCSLHTQGTHFTPVRRHQREG